MKQENNPMKVNGKLWIYENPEKVLVIADTVDMLHFSCGCMYDVIIAKKEVWEAEENMEMRLILFQSVANLHDIILI